MSHANLPFNRTVIDATIDAMNIDPGTSSIRELCRLVDRIEKNLNTTFVRMELGVPNLKTNRAAIDAEIDILTKGSVSNRYSPFDGIPALKNETSVFMKKFLNIDVPPDFCFPTIGAMHGGFLAQAVAGRVNKMKNVILFLDPGFPVNKIQNRFLGLKADSIDIYEKRGDDLIAAVEARLKKGDVAALFYSNPNNPTWITYTEAELRGFGRILTKYDTIAIEDLAYLGMDFEDGYENLDLPPYPPTVARYTDNYIILISSSKIFSYAGQRIGLAVLSPQLFQRESDDLEAFFGVRNFGHCFSQIGLCCTTSGVPQAPQHGLTALLQKVNSGDWNFLHDLREYQERARFMKNVFQENGFQILYQEDGQPLRDGFYFTYIYPDLDTKALSREQLYYGFSSLSLFNTGVPHRDGFRACVSQVGRDQFETLKYRLQRFHEDHG